MIIALCRALIPMFLSVDVSLDYSSLAAVGQSTSRRNRRNRRASG
jgi:hypothetical protein